MNNYATEFMGYFEFGADSGLIVAVAFVYLLSMMLSGLVAGVAAIQNPTAPSSLPWHRTASGMAILCTMMILFVWAFIYHALMRGDFGPAQGIFWISLILAGPLVALISTQTLRVVNARQVA